MRYYIIAGEASGDLHGSNLIKALHRLDAGATIRAWGGGLMEAAGATIIKHYEELAFMGFIEVVKNLPAILSNIKFCKQDITSFAPDVVILVDYPGFNLRIAKWARQQGFKVVYYISPQVWAWKEGRVKGIKKWVDKMLVILPFEKTFYEDKWNYKVVYVGHPLVEVVSEAAGRPWQMITASVTQRDQDDKKDKPVVALLPGSRKQEIQMKLPLMLEATKSFPHYQFIIAQAPGQSSDFYQPMMAGYPNVQLAFQGQTYALLNHAKAALVTSGTATLETALFGVPQVICYKGSAISYQIAKRLVKIKFIGLVNLIMDKEVVKELIQNSLTVPNMVAELARILTDENAIGQIAADYAALKTLLAKEGNASARAAREIVGLLQATF